jgi:flagellar capping protein FliD
LLSFLTRWHDTRLNGQEATATAELRKMLEDLRETATQYDLALEQTLQRIERKLDDLESRVAQLEQQQSQQVIR